MFDLLLPLCFTLGLLLRLFLLALRFLLVPVLCGLLLVVLVLFSVVLLLAALILETATSDIVSTTLPSHTLALFEPATDRVTQLSVLVGWHADSDVTVDVEQLADIISILFS